LEEKFHKSLSIIFQRLTETVTTRLGESWAGINKYFFFYKSKKEFTGGTHDILVGTYLSDFNHTMISGLTVCL
jgi:hypothetical protein